MDGSTLCSQLDLILNTIADAVVIVDANGRVVLVNSAIEKIFKVKRDDIIGRSWAPMFKVTTLDGTPIPKEETPLARALQKGELTRNTEYIYEYLDGERRVLSVNVVPMRNETGEAIGAIISVDDVTERKRVEEALRESEKRYRTLFEIAGDAVFIIDAEGDNVGKIVSANQAAASMHDYTIEELLSLNIQDLDTPEAARLMPERTSRILSGERIKFEAEHFKKDGAVFPVEVYASLLELDSHKYVLSFDRDITESKRAKRLSDALNELNAIINSTLNFDEIMQRVVISATKAIGAETAAIIMREDHFWVARYAYGFPPEQIGTRFREDELRSLAMAVEKKGPIIINDVYNATGVNQEIAHRYSVRSLLSIPLTIKGSIIGTLNFYNRSAVIPFNEAQKDFAGKLSTSLSLSLENARLYESEHRIADTLQEALLTVPERIEGVRYGYLYRSATEAAKVGGDFYDIFELEHDRVGIVIGDVSGQGIEAATLTSLVKGTVKALTFERSTPAQILAETNELMIKTFPPSMFITVFLGVLDLASGELCYCSGGHPMALIKRVDSRIDAVTKQSPMIGAFPGFRYYTGKEKLHRGDTLVLYTDGVIEARCNGGFYGEDRLITRLKSLTLTPTEDIPYAIFEDVMRCTAGKLSDDIAILAVSIR